MVAPTKVTKESSRLSARSVATQALRGKRANGQHPQKETKESPRPGKEQSDARPGGKRANGQHPQKETKESSRLSARSVATQALRGKRANGQHPQKVTKESPRPGKEQSDARPGGKRANGQHPPKVTS